MKRIVIVKRFGDYMAHLEGNRGFWGCGKTYDEAVGSLIRNHPELFSIAIICPK